MNLICGNSLVVIKLIRWQVSMPSLVMNSIKIISDAGLGMAMFSLGKTGDNFCCC